MIRAIFVTKQGDIIEVPQKQVLDSYITDQKTLLWVDFYNEPQEAVESLMIEKFKFHPLSVDDAVQENHVPKLDDWIDYLYIVLHSLAKSENSDDIETLELDIFLGKDYLVTYHEHTIEAVDKVFHQSKKDARILKRGPDFLLYNLIDQIVSDYMLVIEDMDEEIDTIEDRILDSREPSILENVLSKKRSLLTLRRILSHQREVLNKLARDEYPVIDAKDRIYFRDIYDHLVRIYDITESMRDLIGGALDTYLSVVNNRMNDIMKTLTIIATIFMPISFVTGFFGMNFFQPVSSALGPWTGVLAFAFCLLIVIGTPTFMLWWIKGKGWL